MSTVRNVRNRTNKSVTIKRFVENTAINSDGYIAIKYIELNNYYLYPSVRRYNLTGNCTIIVRCEIDQNAEGVMFGCDGGLRLYKSGNTIYWYCASAYLHSVTWSEGVHDIGFINTVSGIKPYYDGIVSSATSPSGTFSTCSFQLGTKVENGTNGLNTGEAFHSTSTWAWRIYDASGLLYLYVSGTINGMNLIHYFPVRGGQMYETMGDLSGQEFNRGAGPSISGVTNRADNGPDCTYGIQINDLQRVTELGYAQLVALLASDGGANIKAGWQDYVSGGDEADHADNAETVVVDNQTHKFAFYLPANRLPSGATVSAPSGYNAGDLIRGRTPKWSLFAEAPQAIKHLTRRLVGQNYKYEMHFNLFKDSWGRTIADYTPTTPNRQDQLKTFDGYSNMEEQETYPSGNYRENDIHYPQIIVNTPPVVTTYNGVAFSKNEDERYKPGLNIYPCSSLGEGSVMAKVGNLPWWKLTASEQLASINNIELVVFGLAVKGEIADGNSETGYRSIFQMYAVTNETDANNNRIPLCSQSSDSVKQLFQHTGVKTVMRLSDLAYSARIEAEDGELAIRYTMGLARTWSNRALEDHQIIDCSSIIPSVNGIMKTSQNFSNLNIAGFTGGKAVVWENSASKIVNIYVSNVDDNIEVYLDSDKTGVHRTAFGMRFLLADDNKVRHPMWNETEGVANPTDSTLYAYVEYTRMASILTRTLAPYGTGEHYYYGNPTELGECMFEGKTNTLFWAVNTNDYFRAWVRHYSSLTGPDMPSIYKIYTTTRDDIVHYPEKYFFFYRDQYISPLRQYVRQVNNASDWPETGYFHTIVVKNYGDDAGSLWIYRNPNYQLTPQQEWIKAEIVHADTKDDFPQASDYYLNDEDGKIYYRTGWGSSTAISHIIYWVERIPTSYASKSNFPAVTNDTPYLSYAEDTGLYYGRHYSASPELWYKPEEEEVVSSLPSTGEIGKVYRSGGNCYRWGKATASASSNSWVQIPTWYKVGEMIERRNGFVEISAMAYRHQEPYMPRNYNDTIIGEGDDNATFKFKGETLTTYTDDWSNYGVALVYTKDLCHGASEHRQSQYNAYTNSLSDVPLDHPKTVHYHIYDKLHAPHAWAVKGNGNATFDDKSESWVFQKTVGQTQYYYQIVDRGNFVREANDQVIASFCLRLYYKSGNDFIEVSDYSNIPSFVISVYKQSACKQFVTENEQVVFDDTYNIDELAILSQAISGLGDYSPAGYSIHFAKGIYEGFGMSMQGNVKSGIYNVDCMVMTITKSGAAPEMGATYLIDIY